MDVMFIRERLNLQLNCIVFLTPVVISMNYYTFLFYDASEYYHIWPIFKQLMFLSVVYISL